MFCTQCGQVLREGAKFCSRCGHLLPGTAAPSGETIPLLITVAVNKNISLIQTAPYILRLERHNCGLIKIDPDYYAQITHFSVRDKEKENAFRVFAASLAAMTAVELLSSFPGSIGFANNQVRKLHIDTYYDGDFHRHGEYDRFTIKTDGDSYRGSVSSDSNILSQKTVLWELFGSRFSSHENVHSFDD